MQSVARPFAISLLGDIMLGRLVGERIADGINQPTEFCWIEPALARFVEDADLVVGNLETAVTDADDEHKWPNKAFNFRISPAAFARAMQCLRINYVSLANNHALDFGLRGLTDTAATLDALKIHYGGVSHSFGSGYSDNDEERGIFLRRPDGVTILLLAATTHPADFAPAVRVLPPDMDELVADVERARRQPRGFRGPIVCSLHWSDNYLAAPTPEMTRLGRRLIDAGATIVHGHSAHHLLPYELYGDGVIFYAMGDFVDDYAVSERWRNDLGAVAKVQLDLRTNRVVGVETRMTRIADMRVSTLSHRDPDYTRSKRIFTAVRL